jgi:hypothetical protein
MHQLTLAFTALVRDEVIAKLHEIPSSGVIRSALKMLAECLEALDALGARQHPSIGDGIGCTAKQVGQAHWVACGSRQHDQAEVKGTRYPF